MSKWVMICKRTEDPKLAWLERKFKELGIPSRRNGSSWHAPILEVPEELEDKAWEFLGSPFDGEKGPNGKVQTVDDIEDDDPTFRDE